MDSWHYENLDDDIEELNRNLMLLNQKSLVNAEKLQVKNGKRIDKAEKKLNKTITRLFKK